MAEVLATQTVGERHFVDYRLPGSAGRPARVRYSARVDDRPTPRRRRPTRWPVEVVPGKPEVHRVVGQVRSRVFLVVARRCDLLLLVGALAYWRRRRRWRLHEVLAVEAGPTSGTATLRWGELEVTAVGPARVGEPGAAAATGCRARCTSPPTATCCPRGSSARQVSSRSAGTAYVVRGRVRDARAGRVDLDVDGTLTLRVQTGTHRIRADIRDPTEVSGTLTFTPS